MNKSNEIKLEASWKARIGAEFEKPYLQDLRSFLKQEYQKGKKIYPRGNQIFHALDVTPFEKVKVVILGQDPYHGPGQAHGLSFSVPEGVRFPPSLQNIFKELKNDLGCEIPKTGNLEKWAQQGVLLLNAVLTVEEGKAASHQGRGWELFTDSVIQTLARERTHVAYLLWGSYAQKKGALVDRQSNLVLESVHPSPLSAHRGFFGSKPFSKINAYLTKVGEKPIDWCLE